MAYFDLFHKVNADSDVRAAVGASAVPINELCSAHPFHTVQLLRNARIGFEEGEDLGANEDDVNKENEDEEEEHNVDEVETKSEKVNEAKHVNKKEAEMKKVMQDAKDKEAMEVKNQSGDDIDGTKDVEPKQEMHDIKDTDDIGNGSAAGATAAGVGVPAARPQEHEQIVVPALDMEGLTTKEELYEKYRPAAWRPDEIGRASGLHACCMET